jgi:hypothetical protein
VFEFSDECVKVIYQGNHLGGHAGNIDDDIGQPKRSASWGGIAKQIATVDRDLIVLNLPKANLTLMLIAYPLRHNDFL